MIRKFLVAYTIYITVNGIEFNSVQQRIIEMDLLNVISVNDCAIDAIRKIMSELEDTCRYKMSINHKITSIQRL